jgi:hypothetical protein
MVGLPDFSATGFGRTLWLEVKLYNLEPWMEQELTQSSGDKDLALKLIERASKSGAKQRETVERLGGLYLIFIKKTCCFVIDPQTLKTCRLNWAPSQVAYWTWSFLHSWQYRDSKPDIDQNL